jgi:ATP-dependent helicase HrpA
VREWQDLASQLRQAAKGADVTINRTPAEPNEIHVAILSGLLSHLGLRDRAKREYLGARGARFAIFPGSGPRAPAARLGDGRRARRDVAAVGRTAARIEPEWVEPLAEHLVKRSYSEPRWDAPAASAMSRPSG